MKALITIMTALMNAAFSQLAPVSASLPVDATGVMSGDAPGTFTQTSFEMILNTKSGMRPPKLLQ
jgi:hypothetical protein